VSVQIFALVLVAALIHALWNTWLKVSGDRLAALAVMVAGWALLALCALPFVGWPSWQSAGYLLMSTLVHTCYALTLIAAYRIGDLNVTYAVSRGIGPILVTLVSALVLGEDIGVTGWAAVILVAVGVAGFGFSRQAHRASILLSAVVGCLIASYTVLDGLGARASGSAHAYANTLFLCAAVILFGIAVTVRRGKLFELARPLWFRGLSAGVLSAAGYWIVIWAMGVAPLGLVAATRESSVAIAAVLGWLALRERVRWIPLSMVLAGVILTRVATA
jgi:drug/metabolite transporter (DMT)-like permease